MGYAGSHKLLCGGWRKEKRIPTHSALRKGDEVGLLGGTLRGACGDKMKQGSRGAASRTNELLCRIDHVFLRCEKGQKKLVSVPWHIESVVKRVMRVRCEESRV